MGSQSDATCRECKEKFSANEGGGFGFHLLHCDRCGRETEISLEDIGEPHLAYLKGLPGPYALATESQDLAVKDAYPGEPISEDEYHQAVEELAGECDCGGDYRMDAPPRCPRCGSDDLERTLRVVYD